MTDAQFLNTSSVAQTDGVSTNGEELRSNTFPQVEVVSCWLAADLETSKCLGFMNDTDGTLAAGLTAVDLLDDKLPMSTITVWFPIFVAKTFKLDEDDVLFICARGSTKDGFVVAIDDAVVCGRSKDIWLLEQDFEILFTEVMEYGDDGKLLEDTLAVSLNRDKLADDLFMHLPFTPAAATGCMLPTAFCGVSFVAGTSTTSISECELREEMTLLFPPPMTKYTGELEDVTSLAGTWQLGRCTWQLGRCVLVTLLASDTLRLTGNTDEILDKTVMCGRLLAGEFTPHKGTNGRGLITALFSTECGTTVIRTWSRHFSGVR